jgi:uncharacterized protein GlcG (DUF336 family)
MIGDHSTIHTQTSSFRKVFTTVTMAPIFHFDNLGEWVANLKDKTNAPALVSLPDIILMADAIDIRQNGQIVAAIGVGGAPGGDKDEACVAASGQNLGPAASLTAPRPLRNRLALRQPGEASASILA